MSLEADGGDYASADDLLGLVEELDGFMLIEPEVDPETGEIIAQEALDGDEHPFVEIIPEIEEVGLYVH